MPALAAVALTAQSVAAMRWHRRIVIVTAPSAGDPWLAAQRPILSGWHGAVERDVSVVEMVGDAVTGTSDSAGTLRHAYHFPADRFAVALIGKDGRVALRSSAPMSAERLQTSIDAMPMRRAGQG